MKIPRDKGACLPWHAPGAGLKLTTGLRVCLFNLSNDVPQAVRNIREVRGFGAEALELDRFQAASRAASMTSEKMGAATGRLEALNRAAIYVRCQGGVVRSLRADDPLIERVLLATTVSSAIFARTVVPPNLC